MDRCDTAEVIDGLRTLGSSAIAAEAMELRGAMIELEKFIECGRVHTGAGFAAARR